MLKALDAPGVQRDEETQVAVLIDVEEHSTKARVALQGELAEFAKERGCRHIDIELRDAGDRTVVTAVLIRRGEDHRLYNDEEEGNEQ